MEPDQSIKSKVQSQLELDSRVDHSDIAVRVDDGIVTLAGEVSSWRSKQAARDVAHTITDVVGVVDEMTIVFPDTQLPSDQTIAQHVRDKFRLNPAINDENVQVAVDDGVVTLTGVVDELWKIADAEDDAFGAAGVRKVVNDLAVEPSDQVSDSVIAQDVQDAMRRNAVVNDKAVNVNVEGGHVTLTGAVSTWPSKREAEDAARFTPGVRSVDNRVSIQA